jgi:hypothetical protein
MILTNDADGKPMLVGEIEINTIRSNTDFPWFKKTYDEYKPDSISLKVIQKSISHISIIVFAGTWCSDTHTLLPPFYKVVDNTSIKHSEIRMIWLDRTKKTSDGMTDKFQIINVPTFIILYDGKEIGRIVEIVNESIEKDLVQIINSVD